MAGADLVHGMVEAILGGDAAKVVDLQSMTTGGKKAVVLSFFATYCEPCKKELPFLEKMHEKYRDQGLAVVVVNIDTKPEEIAKVADLVKVIQSETQTAVVTMEHETQAVEAGSASALRTGDVFRTISSIAERSAELAQRIASSASEQTSSTDQVGRAIKDFTGGAVATQRATSQANETVEEMVKLAEGLTTSVAQFKLA